MVPKSLMYDSQSPSKVEAKMTLLSLSNMTKRKSWTVAIRSVFFWRSPVNPSASNLRMRSAPPGFSAQINVNSFDCAAFEPGRTLAIAFVACMSLVSYMSKSWAVGLLTAFVSQLCQPLERAQSRHEAVLTTTHHDKLGEPMKSAPNGLIRDGKDPFSVGVSHNRVLLGTKIDEIAARNPLRLHKLELALQMGTNQQEDAAALRPVIL